MNNKSGSERGEYFKMNEEISRLQKLCEEQGRERDYYIGNAIYLSETIKRVMDEKTKLELQLAEKQQKVEALEWAIGEWKKEEVLWKEREADLLFQLATQTERVQTLEKELEALKKKESLGDGK